MAATMRETVGWFWDTDVHLRPARTTELARERLPKKDGFHLYLQHTVHIIYHDAKDLNPPAALYGSKYVHHDWSKSSGQFGGTCFCSCYFTS